MRVAAVGCADYRIFSRYGGPGACRGEDDDAFS